MTRLTAGNRSIAGKVAIITGAASGMGRATAHLFADEGARVAVVDVGAERVARVVDEITEVHGVAAAHGYAVDVTDAPGVGALVDGVAAAWGGIDIVVNNAGISLGAPIDQPGYEEAWARTLAVNLTAYTTVVRAALPWLLASVSGGRIVNVASTEGLGATAYISPYTASKHGVVGLTRSWAVELGARNITVNCICPGPINTGMTSSIPDDAKVKFARRRVPARRYGDPEEVAHATLSFCLPAASFINGAILPVDGGMVCQNT
jgi:3-oxoacyl-[acyl-carrier protein] reductase